MRNLLSYHRAAFFVLILFIPYGLVAQLYVKAKTITEKEGLSDKRVTCFYKDRAGFMWIGTKNGLNRYDGHSFKIFRPAAGNSISNEVINDIAEDSKGRIWVATMEGLNYYDPVQDHWESLVPDASQKDNDIPSYITWDIYIDRKDRVWIASDIFEFSNYDIAAKKFTYYNWPGFVKDNISYFPGGRYNSIKKIAPENEHAFWLASNKGIIHLDIEKKEFRFAGGGYKSDVLDLRYDSLAKKIFISLEKGKLFALDGVNNSYQEIFPQPEPYPSTQFKLPGKDEIWMASEAGLLKISDDRKTVHLANHILQLSGSLQPGGATTTFKDNSGISWVGTANGISSYDLTLQTAAFFPLLPVSDKSSINNVTSVYFDPVSVTYFVCTNNPNSVFLIFGTTGQVTEIKKDGSGKAFAACNIIRTDRSNTIWLLTENNAYTYDRNTHQFTLFPLPNNGADVQFRDMAQDAAGNYWFGSFHKGIYYYLTAEKRFAELAERDQLYLQAVTALLPDKQGKGIWIGTFSAGLAYYNLQTKTLDNYTESGKAPEYAALNLTNDLTIDSAGSIWVATYAGGIYRHNSGQSYENSFTRFDMKTGLGDNSYLSVCSNGDSILWLLSGKGVSAMTNKGRFLHSFNTGQLFSFSSYSSDIRYPHRLCYDAVKKELLAGVGGGLLIIPTQHKTISRKFPLAITGMTVNGNKTTGLEGIRRIPFRLNAVSYDFAGLYYGSATGFTYEYMLEGYNDDWVDAEGTFQANYQNLPPGTYSFKVRVKDAEGNIAGVAAAQPFKIIPPFWLTWWFYVLLSLLLALLIYFLFKRRVTGIKNKAAIKQQLAELEAKALRAQMNPHFIFNSLNAIQECIVTEKTDAAFEYLSKFSRLLRLVLNNSEKNLIPLSSELEMVSLYLSLESLRFRDSFSHYIEIDERLDLEEIEIPGLIVQPYVENALWHGLQMKEGEKKVWVRFIREGRQLTIEVEDNGIGREKAMFIKEQKLGGQRFESKGADLSQQRIEVLNRQPAATASVEVIDLHTAAGTACGTKVIIRLSINLSNTIL